MHPNDQRFRVKRTEFGHGERANMDLKKDDVYPRTGFRGFSYSPGVGRDYESNVGYRENYNRLAEAQYAIDHADRKPVSGSNRGKGPRSYQRSDSRILEDIHDYMCDNAYLDATDIHVDVSHGDVVLTGTVENQEAKRLAEDVVEIVSGVKNVENRLRVNVNGI